MRGPLYRTFTFTQRALVSLTAIDFTQSALASLTGIEEVHFEAEGLKESL